MTMPPRHWGGAEGKENLLAVQWSVAEIHTISQVRVREAPARCGRMDHLACCSAVTYAEAHLCSANNGPDDAVGLNILRCQADILRTR